jgi:hypothetical protein
VQIVRYRLPTLQWSSGTTTRLSVGSSHTQSTKCCSARLQTAIHTFLKCSRNCAKNSSPSSGRSPIGSMLKWSVDLHADSLSQTDGTVIVHVILSGPQSGSLKCFPSISSWPAGNQSATEKLIEPLLVGAEEDTCRTFGGTETVE